MFVASDLSRDVSNETDRLSGPAMTLTHPDDVLHSRSLSMADKRAILAAWVSDAHAVPNLPAMRQLDSGAIVSIDTVLAALRTLDASETTKRPSPAARGPWARPGVTLGSRWRRPQRHRDDDDEPPPCPATALPPGIELELRRRRDAAWKLAAA